MSGLVSLDLSMQNNAETAGAIPHPLFNNLTTGVYYVLKDI